MEWETQSMSLRYNSAEGILYISPPEGYRGPEKLEQAQENTNSMLARINEEDLKGIIAFLPNHYVSAEATIYYKKHIPNVPIALIEDTFLKRVFGNMLFAIQSSERPIKMFINEQDAYAWLKKKIAFQPDVI